MPVDVREALKAMIAARLAGSAIAAGVAGCVICVVCVVSDWSFFFCFLEV